jgi:hypothetical protein
MVGFGPPASRSARREGWRRQIQRQKEGSLSVAEFCRRLGVSTVTLRRHRLHQPKTLRNYLRTTVMRP